MKLEWQKQKNKKQKEKKKEFRKPILEEEIVRIVEEKQEKEKDLIKIRMVEEIDSISISI